jgi:hypothetical protein
MLSFISATICAALISVWWFIRNAQEFPGDILGTATIFHTYAAKYPGKVETHTLLQVIEARRWWRFLDYSYWGLFGYMTKYMWHPIYFVYTGFLSLGAAGIVKALASFAKSRPVLMDLEKQDLVIWSGFGVSVIVNIALVIWTSMAGVSGPQGRYLFGSEVPLLVLILAGLTWLTRRWGQTLALALVYFNAAVCLGVLIWFIRMYGFRGSP